MISAAAEHARKERAKRDDRDFINRLGPCPFCKDRTATLYIDQFRDLRITTGAPSRAFAYCTVCGGRGPSYSLPLTWLRTEPAPEWDPRSRAVAAWNGSPMVDGNDGPPAWV